MEHIPTKLHQFLIRGLPDLVPPDRHTDRQTPPKTISAGAQVMTLEDHGLEVLTTSNQEAARKARFTSPAASMALVDCTARVDGGVNCMNPAVMCVL